jgi:hypothetical protein
MVEVWKQAERQALPVTKKKRQQLRTGCLIKQPPERGRALAYSQGPITAGSVKGTARIEMTAVLSVTAPFLRSKEIE